MRKLLIIPSLLLTASLSITAFAKTGDIVGKYYSTDIKTYLNGSEIEAINIGGQTLISAEAMQYYGFHVYWHPEERTLTIDESRIPSNEIPPQVTHSSTSVGVPIGNYYETDIITYLDNETITAYNTGGKTYIHAEAMRDFGYRVKWLATERKLDIKSPVKSGPVKSGYVYDIRLLSGKPQTQEGTGSFSVKYTKDSLLGSGDTDYLDLSMHSSGKDYNFTIAFYQNDGLFYSTALMDRLRQLCYDGFNVETPCDKSEKYDLVNQNIEICINGHKANKVSVTSGAGNGHRDFYVTAEDLPAFEKDSITEIIFTVGNPSGEPHKITD